MIAVPSEILLCLSDPFYTHTPLALAWLKSIFFRMYSLVKYTLSLNSLCILPPLYISHLSIPSQQSLLALNISFSLLYIAKCKGSQSFQQFLPNHLAFFNMLYCHCSNYRNNGSHTYLNNNSTSLILWGFLRPDSNFSKQAQYSYSYTSHAFGAMHQAQW